MRAYARLLRLGRRHTSPGFAPYLIPMTPDPGNMKNFGTSPAGTCLFFRVLGSNKTRGKYQLYRGQL